MADDDVPATADTSRSTESVVAGHTAAVAQSTSIAVAQNEVPVDLEGCAEGQQKPVVSAGVVAHDLVEGEIDSQELDYEEEPEVEQTPGTPASLPSLASEPEDTCTPVKFCAVRPTVCSIGR